MELITAVQQLGGKGLVQFPQAYVVHLQIESLEESRNSEHGPDAHFIGLGSRHCHADIAAERRETTPRSEEHTSELQSLMRISYAVFCLKKKIKHRLRTE